MKIFFAVLYLAIVAFMSWNIIPKLRNLSQGFKPRAYSYKGTGIILRKIKSGLTAFIGDGFFATVFESKWQAFRRAGSALLASFSLSLAGQAGSLNLDRVMHPHMQVLPVIPQAQIVQLRNSGGGFRKAYSMTMQLGRQSKASIQRQLDNHAYRAEDWNRKEASSEPVDISSFPTYGPSATKQLPLSGALPAGQEIRELHVITTFAVKSNTVADVTIARDANLIAAALFNRFRATIWGIADTYNLYPSESRTLTVVATARDPFTQFMPIGSVIPASGGSANTYKLKMTIPFIHRNLEVPEIFSTTTDQMNLSGSQLNLDTNGSNLVALNLGVTPVATTVTVIDVRAQVVLNAIPILHAGPPMFYKSRQVTQSIDTEAGQGVDLFAGAEETVSASIARVAQWTIARDSRQQPLNIQPDNLAAAFGESNFTMDGLLPYDITGMTNNNNMGTQQGAQVVPLEWADGRVRASAWQWPFFTQNRQIRQNLQSGQSATFNLLFWQVRPIFECAGQLTALASAAGITISNPDQLMVRGGADGMVQKIFKGRYSRAAGVSKSGST